MKKNGRNKTLSIFSKVSFKMAMYAVGILIVVWVCKSAFEFGVLLYSVEGVDPVGSGKEVVVTIPSGSDDGEIAAILKKNGLIESELAFRIQMYLYEAEIYSGTYTLSTEYGPEELIEAMQPVEGET